MLNIFYLHSLFSKALSIGTDFVFVSERRMNAGKLMFLSVKSCFPSGLTNTHLGLCAFFCVLNGFQQHRSFLLEHAICLIINFLSSVYWTTHIKPLLSWLTPAPYLMEKMKSDFSEKLQGSFDTWKKKSDQIT